MDEDLPPSVIVKSVIVKVRVGASGSGFWRLDVVVSVDSAPRLVPYSPLEAVTVSALENV